MHNPKVTVMMPAFNAAKYITPSIKSVLRQDFEDFELVIMDDGSTDGTYGLAASFKSDRRVRLYRNKTNRGESSARNRILERVRGDYLIPHDADDFMLQGRLREQVKFLDKHPQYGAVFGRVLIYSEKCRRIEGEFRQFTEDASKLQSQRIENFPMVLHHNAVMVRKKCFLKAGSYDSGMPFDVDVRMVRRLFRITPFYFLNRFCFIYRRHPASMMQQYRY
jgi:glycosyltransferase involved in cell wall biosynthesis